MDKKSSPLDKAFSGTLGSVICLSCILLYSLYVGFTVDLAPLLRGDYVLSIGIYLPLLILAALYWVRGVLGLVGLRAMPAEIRNSPKAVWSRRLSWIALVLMVLYIMKCFIDLDVLTSRSRQDPRPKAMSREELQLMSIATNLVATIPQLKELKTNSFSFPHYEAHFEEEIPGYVLENGKLLYGTIPKPLEDHKLIKLVYAPSTIGMMGGHVYYFVFDQERRLVFVVDFLQIEG